MARPPQIYNKPMYNPFSKLPLIGPWYGRIGRVHRIWSMPCSPTPWIMVKAALVSTPRLAWSLVKPDFLDLKYDALTKNRRRHGRRGKMKIHVIDQPVYAPGRGLQRFLFTAAEFAQRAGWYLTVIDATTEFVVNWSTLTYQYSGCEAPGINYAYLSEISDWPQTSLGGTKQYNNFQVNNVSGIGTGPTGMSFEAGMHYTIAWGCSIFPYGPGILPPATTSARLVDVTSGITFDHGDRTEHPDGVVTYSGFVEPQQASPHIPDFSIWIDSSAGEYNVTSAYMHGSASYIKLNLDLKPDPP